MDNLWSVIFVLCFVMWIGFFTTAIVIRRLLREIDFLRYRLDRSNPWAPTAEIIEPGQEWKHGIRPDGSRCDEV